MKHKNSERNKQERGNNDDLKFLEKNKINYKEYIVLTEKIGETSTTTGDLSSQHTIEFKNTTKYKV